jgi:mannose-6-phosphate isomerase-like protein (cupin superfamily)
MNANNLRITNESFLIEDLIRRSANARFTREYNCDLRRLYPWPGRIETKRQMTEMGVIWIVVEARSVVDRHHHDEEESFVVISGRGDFELEGQTACLYPGDVAYVPRSWRHQIANPYDENFVFLDIYWDLNDVGHPSSEFIRSALTQSLVRST